MAPESRDEVRQRIDSLYDQAENATGNYNATRAMSGGSRSRGVPLFKRTRRDDPGLDNIAREWFEGARSRLGPSVPAALPTDRQPNRPGPRRPLSAMAADLLGQLEDSGPARLELTAGPSAQSEIEVVRELPSRPRLELTAGPAAAVPAVPSGAPRALPAAGPQRPTPGASKTKNQLKLAKAREVLSQRTGQRAIAALDPAPVPVQIPVAQAAGPAPSPWPTPEAQAPAQPWQAPPVGIPNQRTGSGSFRADSRAATRALPAVTETGGIPIVSPSDTGTFRIMTPGGADSAPTRAAADSTGFRVMTPGSADSTPPRAAADSTGFRVMTPGGSGGGTYQTGPAMDAGAAQAPAPSPGDSGSFRIMTPGATGSFPMPTPADGGTFPAADPLGASVFPTADPMASTSVFPTADPMASTSVFPTAAPTNTGAFPTADPMNGGGAFPTAAPAVPPAAPAPMDLGGYRVMSPNAPAAYADIPPAAADTAYANGAYPAAAPAAPMAAMPPAAPFAAAPAADNMYGTYAAGMQPAEGAYAYAATTAMPTAMAAPAAAMPAPMTMPMPMPMAAPMQAPMAAPPAPAAPAMPAMPTAMTAPPEAMMAAAPAMAMPMAAPAPAAPVFTPPLPTTPLPTAPAQVAAPVPAPAAPAPGAYADPAAFVQPGAGAEPGKAMKALAFAREQIGRPCVWGATGPGAYDASSLTQAAWRAAGVSLPRTAAEQTLAGTPITLAAVEPGDLVFFFDDDSHVGIYAGGGAMVHAPSPGALIREESIYNAGESAIHRVIRPA
ncbi:NlpC/P60 family protein [Streptomyces sp. NPDC048291]|uniref:C40 family peptidase n=1 Tax=Streptomyces sp. NPDC048291 TaxID=3365530 RepID=UPI003714A1C7